MNTTLELDDLNGLIDDLETQINEVELPRLQAFSTPSAFVCDPCKG